MTEGSDTASNARSRERDCRRTVLGNVFTVGAFTMLSRVLGLIREVFQGALIGAGVEQSAFTLAFAIPNMARKLFGEGALTAALVPVFKGDVETEGLEKAAKLARAVMTMVLLLLASIVMLALAGVIGALAVSPSLSPRAELTLTLVAIMIPYMFAICGAAFGMGILNSLGRFKASSFMPSLLNLIWISTLLALAFFPGLSVAVRIRFVASAILLGGFAQMAFMFYCMARAGVSPRPTFSGWRDSKVRLVWSNLAIAAVGAGAVQLNYMLDQVLAQCASPWAAGVIGYAERLMDLPLGVIGVAFGTVLLPVFAGFFARGDVEGARAAFTSSLVNMMLVMIPAAAGLAVLAPEVTRVIYERGAFDPVATTRVSRALAVYAVGLAFFGFQKTIIPWFQAQNDMKTPLKVSVMTVIANALLNIMAVVILPEEWRHVGLAASTVLCAFAGAVILVAYAKARNGSLGLASAASRLVRILVSTAVMVAVVLIVKRFLDAGTIVGLAVTVGAGGAAYLVLSLVFGLGLPRRMRRAA